MPPRISLIVVSFNTRDMTLRCVESLARDAPEGTEIVVADNASADGTADALAARAPDVRVLAQPRNVGFARACNAAARTTQAGYLGFVNSDCVAEPGAVARLAAFLDAEPEAAVAVPRLVGPDGAVQRNVARLPSVGSISSEYLAGRIGDPYRIAQVAAPTAVASCSGAAMLIRAEDFWAAGGFHEAYFMYVEDVELSRRLRALGKRIVYVPDAVMTHAEGGSSRPEAGALGEMLEAHRRDYVRRNFGAVEARLALAAMRLGRLVGPPRNRLLELVRGR